MDTLVYYGSLAVCISLGPYYQKIEDLEMKRNYGAGLGILLACLVCGHNVLHTVFMVWGNILIVRCSDKRFVHRISLAYTWLYLIFLHVQIKSQYMMWMLETFALRLVGMAFEITMAERRKLANPTDSEMPTTPTAVDIIAYSYFYIGLHRGPYYRWKVFNDHFNLPFGVLGECRMITEQKLKKALIYTIGFLILKMKFSKEVYNDKEFYESYGTDYRFLYNIPLLMMYVFKIQMIMMLCTSVCTEAGFGVYPAKCHPVPGLGPTMKSSLLKIATLTPDLALEQEYNFTMLKCFSNDKILLGPKMKDTMRGWDMPTQYWFWAYIYKNLLRANKEIRSGTSFIVWTLWSGPGFPQMIFSSTLWVYLHLEAEYQNLYKVTDEMKLPADIGYSIMRIFCLIYLTPCLVADNATLVLKYYNSIYWIYHVLLLVLIASALIVHKRKT